MKSNRPNRAEVRRMFEENQISSGVTHGLLVWSKERNRYVRNNTYYRWLAFWDAFNKGHDLAETRAIIASNDDAIDAERYRWLKSRMICVDFDFMEQGIIAMSFEMPEGCSFGGSCDKNIDTAMQAIGSEKGKKNEVKDE